MKRIIWSSVGLVFGVLFIVGATFGLTSDTVTCGGETMKEGDICVSKSKGGVTSRSNVDEAMTNQRIGSIVGLAMGALTILGSGYSLRLGLRNRRKAQEPQPAAMTAHWNQPQYPQPPYPQSQYSQPQYSQPQAPQPQYHQQQPPWH